MGANYDQFLSSSEYSFLNQDISGLTKNEEKLEEESQLNEFNELKKEIEQESPDQSRIQDEIGDIFFAATNIARHAGCEPETSLIHSNRKFEKRFRQLEKEIRKNNQSAENLSLDQLETLWKKAKKVVG